MLSELEASEVSERQLLIRTIEAMEDAYNPQIRMLKSPFSSPGYHTTIKDAQYIHSTRNSLIYALGLLDTELEHYETRAFDIFDQLVALQDTDRSRSTFGIWSWFYEETLEQMSPPDWNWADFCGKQLVLALSRHGSRLPAPLYEAVKQAIYNACDAIIIRNVGPHYTNIAIMGAFVTLMAGELCGKSRYVEYGMDRLQKLYDLTMERQAFQEYNSPTYTTVAILELSKIYTETGNRGVKELAERLLHMTWSSVAEHYHAATGQWSGPHSRCYSTMLSKNHQAFLQMATEGELAFFSLDDLPYDLEWYKAGIVCPAELRACFLASEERQLCQKYAIHEHDQSEKWAATYMTPRYSLGSFNNEMMWNQTRTLLAYIDHNGKPVYAHLRFLHDGYDYCSAIFQSIQKNNHVLFGISFITNGGDTHPNLDKIEGSIVAEDLRIRLELAGNLEQVSCQVKDRSAEVAVGDTALTLNTWYAAFEEVAPDVVQGWKWEVSEPEGKLALDLVIHAGSKRTIDFRQMQKAAFVCSLFVNLQEERFTAAVTEEAGLLKARGEWQGEEMVLSLPLKPARR